MKLGNIFQEKINTNYPRENKKTSFDFHQVMGEKEKNQEEKEVRNSTSETATYDYQAMLSEHIFYLREKLQKGDTEVRFQIGKESMTIEEWNGLLDNFDSLQEEILQGMRNRHETQEEKQEREEVLRKLLEERQWLEEEIRQ